MRRHTPPIALLLALLLAACAPQPPVEPTAAPARTPPAPSGTSLPVATPEANVTRPPAETVAPAPSVTPAPPPPASPTQSMPPPTATPELPAALIGPETAGRLEALRTVGLGGLFDSAFAPAGDALLVATNAGIAWLRLPGLAPARFAGVGPAYDIALAPDGSLLAYTTPSDAEAGRTALRRAADMAPLAELEGSYPAFSPDGQTLATSTLRYNEPATTWLWAAGDGAPLAELAGGEPRFSPDGRYIATVETRLSAPSVTRVYPAGGGDPLLDVEATSPAFSPDGERLAVSRDGQVEVYALPGGELGTTVRTRVEAAPAFSADGRELLIVAGPDLIVWDLAANRELRRLPGVNRAEELFLGDGPYFSPRADTLATLEPPLGDCAPGGVQISSTDDGAVVYADDESYSVDYGPDGELVALSRGSLLRLVDLASGAAIERDLPAYEAVAFSPSGATMAISTIAVDAAGRVVGRVELLDVITGERQAVLETVPEDFVFSLSGLRFSPDGERLSALARYGCAAIGLNKILTWELAGGTLASEIPEVAPLVDESGSLADGAPEALAFAPDGSVAAWSDGAGGLVLGGPDGEQRAVDTGAEPTAVDITADGAGVALGDADGQVQLFAAGGSEGRLLAELDGPVDALRFSDDQRLIVALSGGEAIVWALPAGDELARFGVGEGAEAPALSADGLLLLLREPAGAALYELAGGRRVGLAEGDVEDAALGPGQRLLATVDGWRVQLWGVP